MATKKTKKKPAKKSGSRKTKAPAKVAKSSARSAKSPAGAGVDETSATLRASAKSFAFRLLR